jgi:adenylate cyclase class 2
MPKSKKIKPEIEIKLRITDIPTILRKIESLGAKTQGQVFEQNTLYDTPQSDLRRRDMLLRLRAETPAIQNARSTRGERVILTSKAPLRTPRASKRPPRYKERAEREQVAANTARQCAAALTALGFRPAFRYDKFRTTFRLPHLQLDLDETPAGTFLELEGQPQAINRAAHALGFTNQAYLRATYWDLHVADCRRRGAIPKNMLFPQKIIRQNRTLRLTNFPSAFTSQLGLKHNSTTQWSCRPIRNREVSAPPGTSGTLG